MSKKISILLAIAAIGLPISNPASVYAQGVTEIKGSASSRRMVRQAQQPGTGQQVGQRQGMKRKMLMPGDEAKENIQKVTSQIRWNTNLNSALAQANRQNKMVLWVHLVGNLSGAT